MTTLHAETCVICTRRPPEWGMVCSGCKVGMRQDLQQLITEYALLDATPGASTSQRVSGTRTAPLPLRVDVLNLVGPGSAHVTDPHGDQEGDLPPLVWLEQWVRDWRDVRGQGEHLPSATMTELVGWIDKRLDWAADEHPAVDDFAAELGKQVRTLRGANRSGDEPEGRRLGPCSQILDDGRPCGTMVYLVERLAFITCRGCGAEWHRRSLAWLTREMAGERSA